MVCNLGRYSWTYNCDCRPGMPTLLSEEWIRLYGHYLHCYLLLELSVCPVVVSRCIPTIVDLNSVITDDAGNAIQVNGSNLTDTTVTEAVEWEAICLLSWIVIAAWRFSILSSSGLAAFLNLRKIGEEVSNDRVKWWVETCCNLELVTVRPMLISSDNKCVGPARVLLPVSCNGCMKSLFPESPKFLETEVLGLLIAWYPCAPPPEMGLGHWSV